MKQKITNIIQKVISGMLTSPLDFSVDISNDKSHGDYSTNAALILAKKIGKKPFEAANLIKEKIGENSLFKKVEVAGPGFINFFISDKVLIDNLKNIDKDFGKGTEMENKRIIVDFTDTNLFKEFHIGHLMSNTVGEALSRIFESRGAKVKRICYQSDVGLNIAKAIYGMENLDQDYNKISATKNVSAKAAFLGSAYAYGSQAYEQNQEAKEAIIKINKEVYDKSNTITNKFYKVGKKWSLESFGEIYKKLGTKFDEFIFESQVFDSGKNIVKNGLEKGIFEKGDNGAIIFKGEKYGLHTRVFINSEGLPTYEAKDLGLAEFKYKKYKHDSSIIITANEQNEYFKVMLCAMDKMMPELAEKTKHMGHGMLRLPEGKMSSRTGKVITGESLIEKVEELVKEKIKNREFLDKEREKIAEEVAVGAIKYSILKQSIGSDIIYDFDKSISFEGDSGPYLQYSYARAESILRKAKNEKIRPSFKKVPAELSELEKDLYHFPEIVLEAQRKYEPHYLVTYLTDLAGKFNSYYAHNKIVVKVDEFSPYRIALTKAFAQVMKNGMRMLGIKSLEKM